MAAAPAFAYESAVARPMPLEAPVMKMWRPAAEEEEGEMRG